MARAIWLVDFAVGVEPTIINRHGEFVDALAASEITSPSPTSG